MGSGERPSVLLAAAWPSHLEVCNLVAFPQRDLEHIHGADEGRQPGQTLLAAAPNAHQQRISPRGLQDAIDAASEGKEAGARGSSHSPL